MNRSSDETRPPPTRIHIEKAPLGKAAGSEGQPTCCPSGSDDLASMSRSRLERGSDQAAPSSARELMALNPLICPPPPQQDGRPSFWERPSHAPPDRGNPPRGDASRPRPVG